MLRRSRVVAAALRRPLPTFAASSLPSHPHLLSAWYHRPAILTTVVITNRASCRRCNEESTNKRSSMQTHHHHHHHPFSASANIISRVVSSSSPSLHSDHAPATISTTINTTNTTTDNNDKLRIPTIVMEERIRDLRALCQQLRSSQFALQNRVEWGQAARAAAASLELGAKQVRCQLDEIAAELLRHSRQSLSVADLSVLLAAMRSFQQFDHAWMVYERFMENNGRRSSSDTASLSPRLLSSLLVCLLRQDTSHAVVRAQQELIKWTSGGVLYSNFNVQPSCFATMLNALYRLAPNNLDAVVLYHDSIPPQWIDDEVRLAMENIYADAASKAHGTKPGTVAAREERTAKALHASDAVLRSPYLVGYRLQQMLVTVQQSDSDHALFVVDAAKQLWRTVLQFPAQLLHPSHTGCMITILREAGNDIEAQMAVVRDALDAEQRVIAARGTPLTEQQNIESIAATVATFSLDQELSTLTNAAATLLTPLSTPDSPSSSSVTAPLSSSPSSAVSPRAAPSSPPCPPVYVDASCFRQLFTSLSFSELRFEYVASVDRMWLLAHQRSADAKAHNHGEWEQQERERRLSIDTWLLNSFLKYLQRTRQDHRLLQEWSRLTPLQKRDNAPAFLIMINHCADSDDSVSAELIIRDYTALGMKLDTFLCTAWLGCFERRGEWAAAERVWQQMAMERIPVTSAAYCKMVQIYMAASNLDRAQASQVDRLLDEMKTAGPDGTALQFRPRDFANLIKCSHRLQQAPFVAHWIAMAKQQGQLDSLPRDASELAQKYYTHEEVQRPLGQEIKAASQKRIGRSRAGAHEEA